MRGSMAFRNYNLFASLLLTTLIWGESPSHRVTHPLSSPRRGQRSVEQPWSCATPESTFEEDCFSACRIYSVRCIKITQKYTAIYISHGSNFVIKSLQNVVLNMCFNCDLLEHLLLYMMFFISRHSPPAPVCTYLHQFRGKWHLYWIKSARLELQ